MMLVLWIALVYLACLVGALAMGIVLKAHDISGIKPFDSARYYQLRRRAIRLFVLSAVLLAAGIVAASVWWSQ